MLPTALCCVVVRRTAHCHCHRAPGSTFASVARRPGCRGNLSRGAWRVFSVVDSDVHAAHRKHTTDALDGLVERVYNRAHGGGNCGDDDLTTYHRPHRFVITFNVTV
jgi:hypothetical protein